MTKAIAQTYDLARAYRANISYLLLVGCAMLLCFYAFNVYSLVRHTVALQNVNHDIASISGDLSELNTQYLTLTDSITPESMQKFGMVPAQVSEYISRNSSLGRVAMRGNEL
jgi:protein involved in ribonucleotide reduction